MAYVDRINFTDVSFDLHRFSGLFKNELDKIDILTKIGALHKDLSLAKYAPSSSATKLDFDCLQPNADIQSINYDATLTNATRSINQTLIEIGRKYSFSSNDVAEQLSSADPEEAVAQAMAKFWLKERNHSMMKCLVGSMASSGMSNMVYDISTADAITDTNRLTPTNLLTGIQSKFGDNHKAVALTVHSMMFKYLISQGLIDYLPANDVNAYQPTFMGLQLYVDDLNTAGANSTYTSFVLGEKAVVIGDTYEATPFAIVDDGSVATRQYLVMKQRYIRQPYGINFTGTPAGASPTDAELATSGNWTLGYTTESAVPIIKFVANV